MLSPSSKPRASIERQLLSNQLWESVAFLAKAAFMLGLTPWMLRVWGSKGYGEFALASSVFILFTILDFGIRGRTRVALCQSECLDPGSGGPIVVAGLTVFGAIGLGAIAMTAVLSQSHLLNQAFHISSENPHLLIITAAMATLVLLSGILLEPLIVAGRIGETKAATALGWMAALPGVTLVLWLSGSVTMAIAVWLGCLLVANLMAAAASGLLAHKSYRRWYGIQLAEVIAIVRQGFWFHAANTSWLAKTYGTTLLITAIDGPATAGLFFILLRLSEVISGLGAISSDVAMGEIAQADSPERRRYCFDSSYSWSLLVCVHMALIIGFSSSTFLRLWLPSEATVSPWAGVVVAALGCASALNRTATFSAMGLGVARTAARCGLIEAIMFFAVLAIIPRNCGLVVRLGFASLSVTAWEPAVVAISRCLRASAFRVWLHPFVPILPYAAASAVVLLVATLAGSLFAKAIALSLCAVILLTNVYFWRQRGITPQSLAPASS